MSSMQAAAIAIILMVLYSILGGTRLLGVLVPTLAASDSVVTETNVPTTTEAIEPKVAEDEQLFETSPD